MDDADLGAIYNYLRLSDRIATAGQPAPAQLDAIARAGFETVINLAPADSPNAIPEEAEIVRALGMDYLQIPVRWEAPTVADLERFFDVMDRRQEQRLFIHCVANKRVSAFVAVYRVCRLGWDREQALADVQRIWNPDGVWREFVEKALAKGPDTSG